MSNLKHLDPAGLPKTPTFSQVVTATGSRMVFTSGQISVDQDGALIGRGDLAAQTTQAMHNLTLALQAMGASFENVVKTTTFVVGYSPEQRELITNAKKPFYKGGKPPASALVGVQVLAQPEWLIEIEAIAVLP